MVTLKQSYFMQVVANRKYLMLNKAITLMRLHTIIQNQGYFKLQLTLM